MPYECTIALKGHTFTTRSVTLTRGFDWIRSSKMAGFTLSPPQATLLDDLTAALFQRKRGKHDTQSFAVSAHGARVKFERY